MSIFINTYRLQRACEKHLNESKDNKQRALWALLHGVTLAIWYLQISRLK